MELKVTLSDSVLVLSRQDCPGRTEMSDAPPAYEQTMADFSLLRHSSASSSATSSCASSSSAFPSSSSPGPCPFLASSSRLLLSAKITLSVPASQKSRHLLNSLTARLVANESLVYNSGAFEQSRLIDICVRVAIPDECILHPGHSHTFQAEIPYSSHLPSSVQLPDARLTYKVCVEAKTLPASSKKSWLTTALQGTTLTDSCGLLVVQAAEMVPYKFSNIKYVDIGGLGQACISVTPSPCIIGEATLLSLALTNPHPSGKITGVESSLIQDYHLRSQHSAHSSNGLSKHYKPRLVVKLDSTPVTCGSPTGALDLRRAATTKGEARTVTTETYEFRVQMPDQTVVQSSTLDQEASSPTILISHHLQVRVDFVDTADQPGSFPLVSLRHR
ncbi:hypothetical protein PSEUBRA_002178 [Kalmanozyma brasiliensis GHG001]|uniref:uncharacterized protein n=1 Tax=Kalmanozyma brasiliensis (strain GHG001) TaxID=1365824 RepID=UPI002867B371|nr:uncharacterized protein PSEUBRA_002178 [Kalmanozyma brasiliensis GHG001]KAF6767053.1 hypothetical protein PSEUBRA_002178 [Kalmanozyma brasiliensis GHG001]